VIELNAAFIVQLINFCLLVVILNVFLFKPIRKVLAERRQVMETSRSTTESVDQEVREKMASYEARLQEAKAEAALRKADALKQAWGEESVLLEKARAKAAATLGSIRDEVARESVEARELLRKQVESLSDDICQKILGRSL
jgi:F-type H+-transporting ATPase subunit b